MCSKLTLACLVLSHGVVLLTLAGITIACSSRVALTAVRRTRCSTHDMRTLTNTLKIYSTTGVKH